MIYTKHPHPFLVPSVGMSIAFQARLDKMSNNPETTIIFPI